AEVDLDLAGRQARVDALRWTGGDAAGGGDDELVAHVGGQLMGLGRVFLVDDELGEAPAVAQVDEADAAVGAPAVDPAHERHRLADIAGAQLAAGVRLPQPRRQSLPLRPPWTAA